MPTTSSGTAPVTECDLVMKGGITSGVVYPRAIYELSKRYTFRSIGGSSAGAIAAAAAAAAEHGRQSGATGKRSGFTGLRRLPIDLGTRLATGETRLQSLFQPSGSTRSLFAVLLRALRGGGVAGKASRAAVAIVVRRPGVWPFLAGVAGTGWLGWEAVHAPTVSLAVALAISAATWIAGMTLVAALVFALDGLRAIRMNGFGICNGRDAPAGIEPLTIWLDRTLRELAGTQGPLTFSDLERHRITLAVTTTSVTNLRPFQLPFLPDAPQVFFSEAEFAALFPDNVMKALVSAAEGEARAAAAQPGSTRDRARVIQAALAAYSAEKRGKDRLLPFPRQGGLPVVVAARMSLSFPLLVSAVPLWGVEWNRRDRKAAPRLEQVWFSDGGICSNMPIHFFDAALPTRPTFAINLRETPSGESARAWLPPNNASGLALRWKRISSGRSGVIEFLAAIVTTMQTWVDETLLAAPGFRDRTAHVSHREDEGGLNLDMDEKRINSLSYRGARAGRLLRDRFDWDNHLWVRFRTLANVLHRYLAPALRRYAPWSPRREALLRLVDQHTGASGYRVTKAQAAWARASLAGLDRLAGELRATRGDPRERAPRPTPELRVRPRI